MSAICPSRYCYAFGYRSRTAAELALDNAFASGDVTPGECPAVNSYRLPGGELRWQITLAET